MTHDRLDRQNLAKNADGIMSASKEEYINTSMERPSSHCAPVNSAQWEDDLCAGFCRVPFVKASWCYLNQEACRKGTLGKSTVVEQAWKNQHAIK